MGLEWNGENFLIKKVKFSMTQLQRETRLYHAYTGLACHDQNGAF